jgi:hypothetical protein
MKAPEPDCELCPIQNFKDQEVSEVGEAAIALTPLHPSCQQVSACLSDLLTVPQGKPAATPYPQANVTLYQNGRNQPFASCLVIWQACHLMTHRPYHSWQPAGDYLVHTYQSRSGTLTYRLPRAAVELGNWDIRVVLIHLLFAACVAQKSRPWEEEIIINDRIIAEFLGLHQRRDMNRIKKLLLIEALVRQAGELEVAIDWQQKGKIKGVHLPLHPLWVASPTYHVSRTDDGTYYLSGLSLRVLAGAWATYFLNPEGARHKTAYYQYGWLPMSLPPQIMYLWQRHEGAVVMLLHFLFRLRVGQDRTTKVLALLKLIYGEESLNVAWYQAEARRKIITTFEADLEQLFYYGLKPLFDPTTYPKEIQPWWVTSQDLPDDPEAALNFWIETNRNLPKTVNSKRKWSQLLNASLTIEHFPEDWRTDVPIPPKKTARSANSPSVVTGTMVKQARLAQRMSQRQLSLLLHKSQSWIRDIERGRYPIKAQDVQLLASVLPDLMPNATDQQ